MILNKHWTRIILTTLLMLSLAVVAPAFGDSDSDSDSDSGNPSIVGSWEVATSIDPSAPAIPGLFTFNVGDTWTSTTSAGEASGGHGAWEQTGSRSFAAISKGFIFAPDGTLSLLITNRGELEVSSDGNSFVGEFETELSLPNGTVINTVAGTVTGTRITVD